MYSVPFWQFLERKNGIPRHLRTLKALFSVGIPSPECQALLLTALHPAVAYTVNIHQSSDWPVSQQVFQLPGCNP